MKIRYVAALALLASCVQAPAGQLELNEPRSVEVLRPENLIAPPAARSGTNLATGELGTLAPPPKLWASAVSAATPLSATSISAVRQVSVSFEVIGAGAPSVVAHEFLGPGGTPYAREERAIEGSAYETHRFEFVLPVAATTIDTARMSGSWSARLSVDGEVLKTHSFELTP